MNPTVTFLTGNRWRHDEARRLLSGVDVAWARLSLKKPDATDLREVARGRVLDGFRQLGAPCFTENTGLYLEGRDDQPGADFKRLLLEHGAVDLARRFAGARGVARVVVAYTADGHDVHLFEGESEGEMAPAPRGEGGYGWDPLWIPAGYGRTLAELATSKYLVNMRHAPFLALRGLLCGDVEGGVFEAHVTVCPCPPASFAEACDLLGVKCLFIELPRGEEPCQPMTVSHHRGTFGEAIAEVHELGRELVKAGFTVTRTKIEAVGRHPSLQQSDEAAARSPANTYFEHHATITLPPGADLDAIERLCRSLDGYLSRNTRKAANEAYVTIRSHGLGREASDARFDRLVAALEALGISCRHRAREFTLYDSAISVDRGWTTS
ncbi:MAG: hypothetical protein MUF34_04910 [Polyangiaceae bacterium]|jgi:non-canonical purine NTP pyrophosphatase (RdgB/HAM1 family)|nr:hypothetical protein [Polyangiaceae bacterium]